MALINPIPNTGLWGSIVSLLNGNFAHAQEMYNIMNTSGAFGNTVKAAGTIPITLVGTGSELLTPPDPQPVTGGNYLGYVPVTGLQEIQAKGFITIVDSQFIVGVGGAGSYHTPHAWVDMSANTNASVIGYIFAIERAGTLYFSQRVVSMRASAQDLKTNVSGGGFITVQDGDKVSMWVASNLSTVVTIYDLNIGLVMDTSVTLDNLTL